MEKESFEGDWTIAKMKQFLHNQLEELKKKPVPNLDDFFIGQWQACLNLEKDKIEIQLYGLQNRGRLSTTVMKSCTKNNKQREVSGNVMISVSYKGILGFSAAFKIASDENGEINEEILPNVVVGIAKIQPDLRSFNGTCIFREGIATASSVCGTFVFMQLPH
eukprot:Phypoly_transcript_11308.p1 GENE.Phypoly_transcript_11308~~Phypoly_transcript_11308.p1  ORF type:complete len:163 (+),score=22.72 Phypoly_transcript_11308:713-1201(+)